MTTPTDSAPPAAAHGASLTLTLGRCLAAAFAHREGDLSAFARKIGGYSAYGEAGGHLERFGLGNLRVLTVTTSERRAGSPVSLAQRLTSRGLGRCLFADRGTLERYRSDALAPPWTNGRDETVTLAAHPRDPLSAPPPPRVGEGEARVMSGSLAVPPPRHVGTAATAAGTTYPALPWQVDTPTPKMAPTPRLATHPTAVFADCPALTPSIWAAVSLTGAARAAEVIRPSANAEAKEAKIVFMVVLP